MIEWIKDLNNKLAEIIMKPHNMRVALVVGHTKSGDKGAYSKALETTEFDYWIDVANMVKDLGKGLNIDIYDLYTHQIQNYYNRQSALASYINNSGIEYDYVIELHFNAASPIANGTECLHYFASEKGKKASQKLSKYISDEYGTTLRGVKGSKALVNKNDRGYWFAYLVRYPAIIYEPFFGSNEEEALKFKDKSKQARILHEAILNLSK